MACIPYTGAVVKCHRGPWSVAARADWRCWLVVMALALRLLLPALHDHAAHNHAHAAHNHTAPGHSAHGHSAHGHCDHRHRDHRGSPVASPRAAVPGLPECVALDDLAAHRCVACELELFAPVDTPPVASHQCPVSVTIGGRWHREPASPITCFQPQHARAPPTARGFAGWS